MAAASARAGRRRRPRDLRAARRQATLLLLVGLLLAAAGLLTFRAPTCTGGSDVTPAACSAWETSQWLMIAGVFLAALAFLYLGWLLQEEGRRARTSPDPPGGSPSR